MAYQWWYQRGEWWRSGFVCLRDSYHGDTIGSFSVGGIELFHSLYRPLLFDTWHAEPGEPEHMRALLEEHGNRVAAVIVEPLVQGAAGMLVHPPGYLRQVRQELALWLEEHEFESLRQMQGSMSLLRCADPGAYLRANYIKLLQSWGAG